MRSLRLALSLLVLAGSSAVGCSAKDDASDATTAPWTGDGPKPAGGDGSEPGTVESPTFFNTTVTGFVFDQDRKPIYDVVVNTVPATEEVRTNSKGFYNINAGRAFGVITVYAQSPTHVQQAPTCVNLRAGQTAVADVNLVDKTPNADPKPCVPDCAGSQSCVNGFCVTKCGTLCSCAERCTEAAVCEPDPNAATSGVCGVNSHPFGLLCECNEGYVPAGDGASCALPSVVNSCPEHATKSLEGCVCDQGFIPNVSGKECLPPDQAAVVTVLGDAQVVKEWKSPGPAPRAIAFDGVGLWIGDAGTLQLYKVTAATGAVIEQVPLGNKAKTLMDMTAYGSMVYLALSADLDVDGQPAIYSMSTATHVFSRLQPNSYAQPAGLANDGANLASLEGLVIKQRDFEFAQNLGPLDVLLDPMKAGKSYHFKPSSTLRFLTSTQNQYIAWAGTDFDGVNFRTELVLLNAVHKTQSPEIGRLDLLLGGSHVTGLEAFGTTLWVGVAGTGFPSVKGGVEPPKIVEVKLD